MADVFISYSRKDKGFVLDLHEALKARNRDTWVDWEDIPLTAKWLEEVYSGIDSADAFAFVISPDSVGSEVCNLEIDHAAENNKRMVPIWYRNVNGRPVPSPLASHQYIDFETEDFQEAFESLIKALDTDLEWCRAHTRLLTRAKEWDREGQDGSFLLRGKDLEAAEARQVKEAEKEPKLTPLQKEYILVSRQFATRRQRIILGTVVVGLIVAVILGLFAWLEKNEAAAHELAARSSVMRNQGSGFVRSSALLAVESERRSPSLEAEQDLHGALALLRRPVARLPHDDEVNGVAFSSDGKYLASAGKDKTVRVWNWDPTSCSIENPTSCSEAFRVPHEDTVNAVAFSPDGKYLATATESKDKSAHVWDLASCSIESATGCSEVFHVPHEAMVNTITFSPDGRYLATASDDKTAQVWDIATRSRVAGVTHKDYVNAVAFSPDSKYLATASWDKTATVWDLASGNEVSQVAHKEGLYSVAFSPNGKYLATASWDRTARVWEVESGDEVSQMEHEDFVNGVAFSPDGKYLATASWDKTLRLWDPIKGDEVARVPHEDVVNKVAFSPDGKYLATASRDGTARVWEVENSEVSNMRHDDSVNGADFSPDGKYLATASDDKMVRVWDLMSGDEVFSKQHNGSVNGVRFSPDGKYLATGSWDYHARVWEVESGNEVFDQQHEGVVRALRFSPDSKYLATGGWDSTARVWEVESGSEVLKEENLGPVNGVDFSPDGKYLAAASWDKNAYVWDLASGDEVKRMKHDDSVTGVEFSSDGKYLATGSWDKTARVWDLASSDKLASGDELSRLPHGEPIHKLVFSPDGKYLATASWDNTARVWEVESGREIARIPHEDVVNGVDFSPDGHSLATVSRDNTARVQRWDLTPQELTDKVCERLTSNLTKDEWQQYVGSWFYKKTCLNLPGDADAESATAGSLPWIT